MAFDNDTRNKLANLVGKCRALLTDEFLRQCQSTFGIQPDGLMISLEDLGRLSDDQLDVARQLRDRIDYLAHNEEADNSIPNSIDKMLREQAFTVLNRLAAMKMAEARGLIIESVSKGQESEGFQMYDMIGGSAMGDKFARYVCYLRSMFDEIAVDLGSLFDRFSPFGLLFPNEDAFGGLLELLNQKELEHLWAEDETIGWIYQYWNSKEERKAMRDASAAPRNSRELAVRNQFFTPRYVVEFLTDNTLGRTWYEMTRGETRLADQCRYLVRRPTEIFLSDGEEAPQQPEQEGLSQEELLKQPVYIQHRPFKDPREIRLLDPACGSMHFGLYAFDLFEAIYEEGWEKSIGTLKQDFPDKAEFLAQVPRLIIENNIHGVDIDPRAVQIAGLSLWLRAQRNWKNQSIQPANRPQIRKSNIVCAEPMPGDEAMLEEFLETLDPPLLRDLVRTVFEKMKLAGEAGTLLKIEEEIRSAIQDARNAAHAMRDDLFTQDEAESEDFFDSAEGKIYKALQSYAESAEKGDYQKRLFAEDAAHGFAFIDLCRKRYDAVVMNPPFGESTTSKSLGKYIKKQFPSYAKNIACSMVLRGLDLALPEGELGIIVDRSLFYRKKYADVRVSVLDAGALSFVDLGWGVLDSANVEVSAISIEKTMFHSSTFIDLRHEERKGSVLGLKLASLKDPELQCQAFTHANSEFSAFPNSAFVYWVPNTVLKLFESAQSFAKIIADTKQGTAPADTPRFVRLYWELTPISFVANDFARLGHGGSFSPYFRDYYFAIEWRNNGETLKAYVCQRYPYLDGNPAWVVKNEKDYMRPGVHYGKRCNCLNVQLMPEGMVFTNEGHVVFPHGENSELLICGLLNSRLYRYIINTYCGQHKHGGYVDNLPAIDIPGTLQSKIESAVLREWRSRARQHQSDELSNWFSAVCSGDQGAQSGLREMATSHLRREVLDDAEALKDRLLYEDELAECAGLSPADWGFLQNTFGGDPRDTSSANQINKDESPEDSGSEDDEAEEAPQFSIEQYGMAAIRANQLEVPIGRLEQEQDRLEIDDDSLLSQTNQLQSYCFGTSLGRWDIRYATGERQPPELPDPFDPLPVCPPGMLQNADGLPASESEVPESYPLRISWLGILVDDEGHPEDIITRVREALSVIWKDNSSSIEQEACDILKVKFLRDYFAEKKSGGKFFKDHLKRYSKSRRKAPIYWPLSTESGSYTLWIYYHRLTDQTLYQCVSDFIEPKIEQCEKDLQILNQQFELGQADGKTNDQISELKTLINELKNFRDELLNVARLPYKPNLNDGVQITAAPLWKCFRLGAWQKTLKDTWKKLEKGDYDWAHLSYSIWPERVKDKCIKDKSLAIAHGLEDVYIEPPAKAKKAQKASTEALGLE